ncbi:PLC-like phosphodiesterase [Gymnopilus junonius]|uniref:PLC-like phosphodiesterase n=1 Tax=Gymnopilus junonius TaxID=109634 RepID=A0A9P5NEI1_GYMJU|nr:PLC-like phosphodiesterase [Gymnopilus junonius]
MHITIRNLTTEPITAHTYPASSRFNVLRRAEEGTSSGNRFILPPSLDITIILPKGFKRELVLQQPKDSQAVRSTGENTPVVETSPLLDAKEWHIHPEGFKIQFSMTFSASWQAVPVPGDCPWRAFIRRVTRRHHKLLILARRNLATFLSDMPDRLPLSSLTLPGSMAFHGWPISQCQSPSTPLSSQLHNGIRVIDIRLAVIPPPPPMSTPLNTTRTQELIAYHGLWPQRTPFISILNDVYTFLTSPVGQKETIVMSIKQEDFAITPAPFFSQLVRDTIARSSGGWDDSKPSTGAINKGMWFLENRIPTLGEVRGKVIMLSRFGGDGDGWEGGLEGIGIHPTTWPDSVKDGFEWELKGTLVKTSDWYAIPSFFSIPEKVNLATANLIPPADAPRPVLPITYFSAAIKLGAWLIDQLGGCPDFNRNLSSREKFDSEGSEKFEDTAAAAGQSEPRIRGFALVDYYAEPEGGDIIPLLVECNFRGRKNGEEGW